MNSDIYDVVIAGAGPAGLTAGLYTSREGLKTLVLEKWTCGGLAASTEWIENWPGTPDGVKGRDLMKNFKLQAQKFGTQIVESSELIKAEPAGKNITVTANNGRYETRTLIIATGSVPKKLNIPGENEFYGRGVSYCATCDGPFYKGRDIAVIGCGDSGLQEGESLLHFVKSIAFVEFLPSMKAEKILQERVQKKPNTRFMLNHMVTSINGQETVRSIAVKDRQTGEEKKIDVTGVFIYIGFLPNSGFVNGLVELDKFGYIVADDDMRTSIPGIYAAGDVRSKKVRQITTACSEGTIAAMAARDYLKELG